MHTGEDESIEFLMCIDGWVWGRRALVYNNKVPFLLPCPFICPSDCLQGVRLGVRPDAYSLPRPSRAVKVETGCNVGNPCISSPCPAHSRCSDQWERHSCVCEPGELQVFHSGSDHINTWSLYRVGGKCKHPQVESASVTDRILYLGS